MPEILSASSNKIMW